MNGDAHHDGDDLPSATEGADTLVPAPSAETSSRQSETSQAPAAHGLCFTVYGKTDVGLVRDHNEDNFMIADLGTGSGPLPREQEVSVRVSDRGVALAVCDGMGGAAAGEVASRMAVDTLFEMLRGESAPEDRDGFARRLVGSVEEAGTRIYHSAKKDRTRRGMGTTATVAGLVDKVLFVGQVGDSRCYVLRNGQLRLVTKDQSLVNQLVEAGQLTEDEAQAFEHSNIILQALGTTEQVAVDLTFVELRRGDRVLLCSDGLSGLVHDDAIQEAMTTIGPLPQLADRLIDLANTGGGHDNITCIVADFDGDALAAPEQSAAPFYQQYPLPRSAGDPAAFGAAAHALKSAVPRAVAPDGSTDLEAMTESLGPVTFSWSTAASVLALLGLAAAIAIVSSGRRATPSFGASAPPPPAYADTQVPVEVKVRAALDRGELYVNGRSYGPLRLDEAILLRLLPGSYHFEARELDGTQVGKDVLVEAGLPTEVVLIPPTD